ncbi:hypothetical protein CSA56_12065 [candidate division KSB3 bacterium]|uniref:Phospholipid/glycerol acyltransferase domain-containing protein n=1 Tax=candidate division KSB3 bacterium TaxID=2044937 RepID=A0A2G6KCK6_9BACT|nr:MAG: hypothetical protein CSA56_12065 [candidate division KSB3 bacterium]
MLNTDLKSIIEAKSPGFFQRRPRFLFTAILRMLERIVHIDELQDFFATHGEKTNWQFIEAVFDYLDFSYSVHEKDGQTIPEQGRLICVANHATGPLDGLVLLHLLGKVRQDVKIVLTDILSDLDQLHDLFLLYDQYSSQLQKQNILAIRQALLAEQAVIFFPAGEVTKLSRHGLREHTWQAGPVTLARKYNAPILSVRLHARNSLFYYLAARLHHHFSTLLLSHEMFRQRSRRVPVTIGALLPAEHFKVSQSEIPALVEALKDSVHRLEK